MTEEHGGRTQEQIDHEEWENPANWHWGIFYHSARDSRDWVPKRSMFGRRRYGGTPNFAKPGARAHMMILVSLLLLFFLVVVTLERLGVLR